MVASSIYSLLGNAYGTYLSVLLRAKVSVTATPPVIKSPIAALSAITTGKLKSLSVSAEGAAGLAPFASASIVGNAIQLGWKIPALLLVPGWLILYPSLLPWLLFMWLLLPSGP